MERCDQGMPFLLQYENVAWYEEGEVRILDRRIYPREIRFEICRTYGEVTQAIRDMVTQSTGPYTAVGMGMALAGWQVKDRPEEEQKAFLRQAASELSQARPTSANRYKRITDFCLAAGEKALNEGRDPIEAMRKATVETMNARYRRMQRVGDRLCELIPEGGSILTQCYGETIIGTLIRAAKRNGKTFKVFCAETRPYLQGARLTASCFAEAGFDTTVLTDNMIAWAMEECGISLYTSAADTIALDGHIANKVGSFQIAILAKHFGIPYYVTGMPDRDKKTLSDITIEMRNPAAVLAFAGIQTAAPGVKALYPAFDIVPPELISGVVTDRGVLAPKALAGYYEDATEEDGADIVCGA